MYSVAQRLEEQGLKKALNGVGRRNALNFLVSLCKAGHISIDIAAAEMHVSRRNFKSIFDGEIPEP